MIEKPVLPGKTDEGFCFSGFVNIGDKTIMLIDVDHLLATEKIQQLNSVLKKI